LRERERVPNFSIHNVLPCPWGPWQYCSHKTHSLELRVAKDPTSLSRFEKWGTCCPKMGTCCPAPPSSAGV